MLWSKGTSQQVIMGRLDFGSDLLESLSELAVRAEIKAGQLTLVGALRGARLAVYDMDRQVYNYLDLPGDWELTSGLGNVSLMEGRPFVHAHLVLGNQRGESYSGHLTEGCRVFACEFVIETFDLDRELKRFHDQETGLTLWR